MNYSITPKTVTTHQLDSSSFEQYVNQYYDVTKFEFIVDHLANNDSQYSFDGIDGSENEEKSKLHHEKRYKSIAKFNYESWKDFYKRNGVTSGMSPLLLNDMCHRGLLPAGNYVITVSW